MISKKMVVVSTSIIKLSLVVGISRNTFINETKKDMALAIYAHRHLRAYCGCKYNL